MRDVRQEPASFEPQLYSVNVDIQRSVVKYRSLVMQSIYNSFKQWFKTPLGIFIYLNIWKSLSEEK